MILSKKLKILDPAMRKLYRDAGNAQRHDVMSTRAGWTFVLAT